MQTNPKRPIIYFLLATFFSFFSLVCLLNFTNPQSANLTIFIFLYVNIFLLTCGLTTLLGYFARQRFFKQNFTANFLNSFRQGVIFSSFTCASLLLLANGLFYWWVVLSLIVLLVFIELFLLLN